VKARTLTNKSGKKETREALRLLKDLNRKRSTFPLGTGEDWMPLTGKTPDGSMQGTKVKSADENEAEKKTEQPFRKKPRGRKKFRGPRSKGEDSKKNRNGELELL